ncbi:uncharacterized protein TRIADDRAFT_53464 [Trichoplax adhaerens]|uniref:Mitochondrial thiamine pyrophosphate carrier n=1 Tax=Trichoplax adhaerens TaxID=10228 RepID=B3RPA5_TRIAD|nr:hypothetical protein TRIADDRAFT_53464 [Trichoplax adhaerens]EDV27601.1 hypothetical protein TRIADDRAFT_53464 [Trichoplax adhaerens]|eukprot:XP_002109435.1 hypothetical protein TRIADDRAFT_53464 [Trichoplax adhaerens]
MGQSSKDCHHHRGRPRQEMQTSSKNKQLAGLMLHDAIAGGFAGLITRFLTSPLDVIKIRFQLQLESTFKTQKQNSKYFGIYQSMIKIISEEGLLALWKGQMAGQLLSITYGGVQFMSYNFSKKVIYELHQQNIISPLQPNVVSFVCGSIAGLTASTVAHPLDVLRTRFVAQGEPKYYISYKHALAKMGKDEGIRSFYKGLSPTLLCIVPQTGLQFAFYEFFIRELRRYSVATSNGKGNLNKNGVDITVSGGAAGIFSKSIIYPLDVAKKRLEVNGFVKPREKFGQVDKYNSLKDCFLKIWSTEGLAGFYKGLSPSLVKAALSSSLMFFLYEKSIYYLNRTRKDS